MKFEATSNYNYINFLDVLEMFSGFIISHSHFIKHKVHCVKNQLESCNQIIQSI